MPSWQPLLVETNALNYSEERDAWSCTPRSVRGYGFLVLSLTSLPAIRFPACSLTGWSAITYRDLAQHNHEHTGKNTSLPQKANSRATCTLCCSWKTSFLSKFPLETWLMERTSKVVAVKRKCCDWWDITNIQNKFTFSSLKKVYDWETFQKNKINVSIAIRKHCRFFL